MKTKVILLLFILFILSTTGRLVAGSRQDIRAGHNRQNPQLSGQKEEQKKKKAAGLLQPYQGMWKSVDSLTNLGQPRSALKMVNNIYSRAKEEKNEPQFLKTILYRVRLDADFQEDFLDQAVRDIHAELATYMGPASYVMHSILGEIYWKYYQNNVWQLADRTRVNSNETDSLATWDLNTLAQAAVNEYLLSLNNASITRAIPVETYKAILEITGDTSLRNHVNKTDDFLLHPTLFDFLAWRALDFFTCGQQPKTQTSNLFLVDKTGFFAPSPEFSTFLSGPVVSLVGPSYQYDSISRDYFSFRIYQQLVAFHLPDKNPAALIDIELKRLEFMKNKAVFMNTDSLYRMALENLERNFQKSFYTTLVSYQLANWLNGQGQLYRPLESENHRGEILDAATICENAIKRFPASEGAKKCKSLLRSIHEPFLQITCELAVTAENPFLALLGFKNLKELNFRLIKTEPETYAEKSASMERKDFFRYLAEQPATKTWSINLPEMSDYQQHTTEIRIPEVAPGFYVLMGSTDKTFRDPGCTYAATPFWSTRISYVSKRNEKGNLDYFILDRNTGMPMKNIPVEVWTKIYDYTSRKYIATKLNEYFSDDKGFFSIPAPEQKQRETNLFLKIRDKEDLLITDNFYLYPVQPSPERTYQQTMLYTDRAIYRPGQPVYFKGIILEKTGDRSKIRAGQTTTVSFLDVNGQLIAKTKLISNDFGSFNGSFIAPQGVLNGLMTISNESGSVSVSVEEYKRPTFEVVFHPLEGNYKLGKSLTISGKVSAYAGNAIDGAIVRYRVVRTARFPFYDMGWYRPFPVSPETEITHGFTRTGINGQFTIDFRAIPDFSVEKKSNPVFDFRVYADVTDITGEMQSSVQTVSIGYQSLLIGTNIPELVNLLSDSLFTISTTNLNGAHTPADVNINLKHLHQPDHVFKPRVWARPDLMTIARDDFYNQFPNDIYGEDNNPATWSADPGLFEQVLNTGVDSVLHFTKMSRGFYPTGLQPGIYQLVLSSVDPFGEKISKTIVFTVFDPGSKETPVQTMNWFVPLKTSGEPGETARFIMGSKEENINLIYEIRRHDSLISREWLLLNNRSLLLEIPIHESDRGNFSVNFFFVKNNRAFQNSQVITVPYANKKLDIVCETFRDKLDPGAKEEWKIRISDRDKKGVLAEFLASMYDASLNVFRTNTWTFDLYEKYYTINPWDVNNAFRIVSGQWFSTIGETASEEFNILSGYKLNWFGLPYFGNDYRMGRYRLGTANTDLMMVNSSAKTMEAPSPEQQPPASDSGITTEKTTGKEIPGEKQELSYIPPLKIRKDFRETAFFMPSLTTDSSGTLILKFTAPESLTRWKLLGLAHTKNLDYGLLEKELITQKSFMVVPNAPRFVRQGDTIVFSAKVTNLSDIDLSGEVSLELFDAMTLKPLDILLKNGRQSWTVGKKSGTPVSWTVIIPDSGNLSVLQYRITAVSGNFSDGEEQTIPVLSNRMLVTESLALPVRGNGSRNFRFEKLLHSANADANISLKNYMLTFEFASNPAWYAIQALPSLNNKNQENAEDVFASFYSNSLASFIIQSNPRIKPVFESWKNLTPSALLSNLEKNQQLKSALLQETPWVLEAKTESERKQKLGLYFDLNNLESNLHEALKKLQKMQKPSGGWAWFDGMPENRWITQNIITGLGHLDHLGVTYVRNDREIWNMIIMGIRYLDSELLKDFETLNKFNINSLGENHLTANQIQYLYARSYFMIGPGPLIPEAGTKSREAFEYYKKQAEKYWAQNDHYLQGMIALALNRLGNKEIPALILKSLSEKALHSEEMGMYWAQNRGLYWFQAPIESQALMIEAFDEISQNEQAVDDLKLWLLKQKQTQAWENPRATSEACYALLLRGTDLLSEDPDVKIQIGKEKINPAKLMDNSKEAGTGYFQLSWQGNEITPDMGNIRISKSGKDAAWGALYWQYFENLDKITVASMTMKLEKQLFVERNTTSGPVLDKIENEKSVMKSGPSDKNDSGILKIGDIVVVRIILSVDRDLEFVHMKDMRASGLEPWYLAPSSNPDPGSKIQDAGSGYHYQGGLGYYQASTDVATNFFFDYLPKGSYIFEYKLKANAAGEYSNGITTVQCLYAPEFSAHSQGFRIRIGK